jgi:hypothetical protein
MVQCVSTLTVSLPSISAETPRRPRVNPRFVRFLARARAGPSASGFDPAAPARSYRVGSGTTRSKPLAEGICGVCALWHFRLGDRALDPWACGRSAKIHRTAANG